MYGVVEVLFFLWIYTIIVNPTYRLSKKTLLFFIIPLGFLLWMTVASIFAVNPTLSFWSSLARGVGLLTFYHVFAFALVVASLVKARGLSYIYTLFQWFIAGSFILATSIWLGSDGFNLKFKVLETDGGGGLSGNSTLAATYLLFTLAVGLFLISVKSISRYSKWLISVVLFTILFSPVFINIHGLFAGKSIVGSARGTILSLITGVIMSGLVYLFFSQKKVLKKISIGLILAGSITFMVLWAQLVTPGTYIHQKFAEEARGSRFIFWDTASIAMKKHPFLGYGPENYMIAFQENFNPQILNVGNSFEGWADRAHNIYYDLGVWGGYPLIVLYIIFILSIFYSIFTLYKNETLSRKQASIFIGLFVAYILNNLFTFDSTLSLTALFMFIGVLYGLHKSEKKNITKQTPIDSYYRNLIAICLGIACIFSLIYFVKSPVSKSKAYAEIFVMPINVRSTFYKNLLSGSSVGEQWDVSGLADDIYKKYSANPLQFKNDTKLLPYIVEDLASLINYLEEVSDRNTTDYRLIITKAHLYSTLIYLNNTASDPKLFNHILDILNDAKKLSPINPNVDWSRAQIYVWNGDFKSAENSYKEAIAIDPTFASSHKLLIQFAQIIGDQKLYNESIIQAEKDIPGFVETYKKELNIITNKDS
jgi:O-antigen ligase